MATSAGILLHRGADASLEVLLVHPGGPIWERRDAGAWSIPKGEYEPGEEALAAARREFVEELGHEVPAGDPLELGEITQAGGKRIHAWALEGNIDASNITSNTFEMEWPPRSGRRRRFPEIDRAGWFDLDTARGKLVKGQVPLIDLLAARLGLPAGDDED